MSLKTKVDVETIDGSVNFVLKILSTQSKEIMNVLDVLKSNVNKIIGKEFSESGSSIVIEMGGNLYSFDGKAQMPDHVIASRIANFANNEAGVQFSFEPEMEKILIGMAIAAKVNNSKK